MPAPAGDFFGWQRHGDLPACLVVGSVHGNATIHTHYRRVSQGEPGRFEMKWPGFLYLAEQTPPERCRPQDGEHNQNDHPHIFFFHGKCLLFVWG